MAGNLTSFVCGACNAPQTIRGMGQTTTLSCTSCGALIDITNEAYAIIKKSFQQLTRRPIIPLGQRGKCGAVTYEVIGFLVRSDRNIVCEWEEYLLFNPYHGFCWLVQSEGHWSLVRTIKDGAELQGYGPMPSIPQEAKRTVNYGGQTYYRFLLDQPRVRFVYGEFYWRVQRDDQVETMDYISPPYFLSLESDASERTWALGEYLEPKAVAAAFSVDSSTFPNRTGIGMNQPAPGAGYARTVFGSYWLFIALITLIHIFVVGAQRNETVLERSFLLPGGGTSAPVISEKFDLRGKMSNVRVDIDAPILNNWIEFEIDLVNADTGAVYPAVLELSYYRGTDSDGTWVEGATQREIFIPSVRPGSYYLTLTPSAGQDQQSLAYLVKVTFDAPNHSNFLLAVFLLTVFPAYLFVRRFLFEQQRWQNSDYGGY